VPTSPGQPEAAVPGTKSLGTHAFSVVICDGETVPISPEEEARKFVAEAMPFGTKNWFGPSVGHYAIDFVTVLMAVAEWFEKDGKIGDAVNAAEIAQKILGSSKMMKSPAEAVEYMISFNKKLVQLWEKFTNAEQEIIKKVSERINFVKGTQGCSKNCLCG
jgi:hypothetical protein